MKALIFTSEGDMRQAINNLQSTFSGFSFISAENVFKVCDQPHPLVIQDIIRECTRGDIDGSLARLNDLWSQGYSAVDIVTTLFRVVKTFDEYAGISPEYSVYSLEFTEFPSIRSSSSSKKLAQPICEYWRVLAL